VAVEKAHFPPKRPKFGGDNHVQKIKKAVCRASWRNFIFANFERRSFSTVTPGITMQESSARLKSRRSCGRSSFYPSNCNWVFLQFLETDQIGVPIFLRWHIRFRPARAGEVREGFTRMPAENHQRMIRRGRCRRVFGML
jgi:hypothetical protein